MGVGSFFTAHDLCMRMFTPIGKSRKDVSQVGIMCSGASAGFAFWTIAYPIDLIKTKIQGDDIYDPRHNRYHSSLAIPSVKGYIREVYDKGGLRAFYKGYRVSVLRSMYTNFVQLFVYENLHKIAYAAL